MSGMVNKKEEKVKRTEEEVVDGKKETKTDGIIFCNVENELIK